MINTTYATLVAGSAVVVGLLPIAVRRSWAPWSAAGVTVLLAMFYDVVSPLASGNWFYLGYTAFAVSPLLVYLLFVRYIERSPPATFGLFVPIRDARRIVGLAALLAGVYYLLTLEPGLLQGLYLPGLPDFGLFAVLFLTAPVIALGQEAIFRGYLLTKVAGSQPFRRALFASSALFSVVSFNPFLVLEFGASSQAPAIFLTVLTGFALGIFLGLFFYKTHFSVLGTWVFRSITLGISLVFPVAVIGLAWETAFVLELIAITAVLVVVYIAQREPRFEARHYMDEPMQPRRRTLVTAARNRRQVIPLVVVLGVALVIVAFAGPIGSASSKAPVRVLAIESDSMSPTFVRGTLVFLESVAGPGDLHVGMIVAYNAPYLSPNGPVVHRIIAIGMNGSQLVFTFKGDANPSPDPRPVVWSQIVGKVVTYVPYLGYLILSPELSVSIVLVLVLLGVYRSSPDAAAPTRRRPILPLRRERA